MSHIEFIGAPGVGKSTLYSRLISSDDFYGGTSDGAVRRAFLEKADPKERLIYRVTPSIVRRFFEDAFLEYRFAYGSLEEFVRDYPDFIKTMSHTMSAVSYEPEVIFTKCRVSAEEYQLGTSTVRDNEKLCLDESFAQRAIAVLWRRPDETFSLEGYFDSVPTPDVLVHVDAPPEVCLRRQRERGRVEVSKDWERGDHRTVQEKTRELSRRVRDHLANETSVITIDNTEPVDQVGGRLREEIVQLV